MTIPVQCPACGTNYQIRDALCGKQAKCKCGQKIQIPAMVEDPLGSSLLDEELSASTEPTFATPAFQQPAASQPRFANGKRKSRKLNRKQMIALAAGVGGVVAVGLLITAVAMAWPSVTRFLSGQPTHWNVVGASSGPGKQIRLHFSGGGHTDVDKPEPPKSGITTEIGRGKTITVEIGPPPEYLAARDAIRNAIVKTGPATVPQLFVAVKNEDDAVIRWNIVHILGAIDPETEGVVATLDAVLRDLIGPVSQELHAASITSTFSDRHVADAACVQLGKFGPAATFAAPTIAEYLEATAARHPIAANANKNAIISLAKIGYHGEQIVKSLCTYIEKNGFEAREAVQLLGVIGPEAESAIPTLLAQIDEQSSTTEPATKALVKIGPAVVPPLVEKAIQNYAQEPELSSSRRFDWSLKSGRIADAFGELEGWALPGLRTALSENPRGNSIGPTRIELLLEQTISRIERDTGVTAERERVVEEERQKRLKLRREAEERNRVPIETIINDLQSEDKETRTAAFFALMKVEPAEAKKALPALSRARVHADRETREAAVGAMRLMGASGVPELLETLRSREESRTIRLLAVWTLGKIGPDAKDAAQDVFNAANEGDRAMAENALEALESIGPSAIPQLIQLLSSRSFEVRIDAAGALAQMGTAAQEAIPAIKEALSEGRLGKSHVEPVLKAITPQ